MLLIKSLTLTLEKENTSTKHADEKMSFPNVFASFPLKKNKMECLDKSIAKYWCGH